MCVCVCLWNHMELLVHGKLCRISVPWYPCACWWLLGLQLHGRSLRWSAKRKTRNPLMPRLALPPTPVAQLLSSGFLLGLGCHWQMQIKPSMVDSCFHEVADVWRCDNSRSPGAQADWRTGNSQEWASALARAPWKKLDSWNILGPRILFQRQGPCWLLCWMPQVLPAGQRALWQANLAGGDHAQKRSRDCRQRLKFQKLQTQVILEYIRYVTDSPSRRCRERERD